MDEKIYIYAAQSWNQTKKQQRKVDKKPFKIAVNFVLTHIDMILLIAKFKFVQQSLFTQRGEFTQIIQGAHWPILGVIEAVILLLSHNSKGVPQKRKKKIPGL